MKFSKKELKIFLTFFIIYSIFVHWAGWNENSRFDLTRVIVEEGRLETDSYFNQTSDRSIINNHYYSNKAPSGSLVTVPIYASWKFLLKNILDMPENKTPYYISHPIQKTEIIEYINPDFITLSSMIIAVVLTSSLFSALTVIILYKISAHFTNKEFYRILIILIYGLGTVTFPYASVYMGNSLATFFLVLSFYLILESRKKNKFILLAGLASGFSITIETLSFTVVLGFLIYLTTKKDRNKTLFFLVPILIGLSPLFVYNYLIMSNPFDFTQKYLDQSIWSSTEWKSRQSFFGFELNFKPPIILNLLMYPYRGLLFYNPLILLSIVGFYFLNKKDKWLSLTILFSFLFLLLLNSSYFYWWGGTDFGPRFFLIVIPFLTIPLLLILSKINLKIISIMLIISITINVLGLQKWEQVVTDNSCCEMITKYKETTNSFGILANPIASHYLALTTMNGPRSRLIEGALHTNSNMDIRETEFDGIKIVDGVIYNLYDVTRINILTLNGNGFLIMKTTFATLIILLILIFLIWNVEISKFVTKHKMLFIVSMLIIILISFNIGNLYYKKNWYETELSEEKFMRWSSQDGEISLYSKRPGSGELEINMRSYYRNKTMEIWVNEKLEKNITIPNYWITKNIEVDLRGGVNSIIFHSVENCDVPMKVEDSNDARSLCFAFRDLKINI
jgi:hypothetical protein